jgi:hypothetical protein
MMGHSYHCISTLQQTAQLFYPCCAFFMPTLIVLLLALAADVPRRACFLHFDAIACCCCSDLVPLIRWNEAHGIRLFRLSSCILPWMTSYQPEELPDWPEIQAVSTKLASMDHSIVFVLTAVAL